MAELKAPRAQIKRIVRELDRLGKKETLFNLNKVPLLRDLQRWQSAMRQDAPIGAGRQGHLRTSFVPRVARFAGDVVAEMYTTSPYAHFIEFGRPAGTFPKDSADFRAWIRRKINPPQKQIKSVSYLIRRKIFREGTDPQPFWENNRIDLFGRNNEKLLRKTERRMQRYFDKVK